MDSEAQQLDERVTRWYAGRPSTGLPALGTSRAEHVARYRLQRWRWLGAGIATFLLGFLALGLFVMTLGSPGSLPWFALGAMVWGVACSVRCLIQLSRVQGLDHHSPIERFHGPGPASQPSAKLQRRLRGIGVRPGSVVSLFVLPGSNLLVHVGERPVPVKRIDRVALTSAPLPLGDHAFGSERDLSPLEQAELRALWVRSARPNPRVVVGFAGLATGGLGFPAALVLLSPLDTGVLAYFFCGWALSALLLYGAAWAVRVWRAKRRPMSHTLLTRNGDTLLVGHSKLLWQEADVPGPARLARGGLLGPHIGADARALLEVHPVTF